MKKTGKYWKCIKKLPVAGFVVGEVYAEHYQGGTCIIVDTNNSPHYTPEYSNVYKPYFIPYFPFKYYAENIKTQLQGGANSEVH